MLTIETIKERLSRYFVTKPVSKAWIFGSYARGEENPESDLDVLVDFEPNCSPSLLGFVHIMNELTDLLNLKVDLVKQGTVIPEIAPFIEKDKILVYERRT